MLSISNWATWGFEISKVWIGKFDVFDVTQIFQKIKDIELPKFWSSLILRELLAHPKIDFAKLDMLSKIIIVKLYPHWDDMNTNILKDLPCWVKSWIE